MEARKTSLMLVVVSLWLGGSALEAQRQFEKLPRNLELGRLPIQFTLAPPGARSLGMGGAFIAIADDATASESNPAGLTILNRPEFSLHVRDYSFDGKIDDVKAATAIGVANVVRNDQVNRRAPLCGVPGTPPCMNFNEADSFRDVRDSSTDPSFVSYVKPFRKWVFSIYYSRFANFEATTDFGLTDALLQDTYAGLGSTSILAESLGFSGAFKINDRLSFGTSVRFTELDVNNRDVFQIDYFSDLELETFQFGELDSITLEQNEFTDILRSERTARGTDSDLTYNVGFLWDANQKFSAGVVFKKGGDFDIATTTSFLDCISFAGVSAERLRILRNYVDLSTFGDCNPTTETVPDRITIPDLLGFGFAVRPSERFTAALDLNLVSYSDLSPPLIRLPTRTPGVPGAPVTEEIDDELEVHVGGEYVFLAGGARNPVTLRAGLFNEPDHDGFANVDSDDTHFTVGTGVVLKGQYQFDFAASFSDRQDVVLFSFVYRR